MEKYETPDIKFDKVTFFENIASDCWSSNNFYFDHINRNCQPDYGEDLHINMKIDKHGDCKNAAGLTSVLKKYFKNKEDFEEWECYSGYNKKETRNSTRVKDIYCNSSQPPCHK